MRLALPTALALTSILMTNSFLAADEGLWPFNAPPRQLLKDKHKFEITDVWLNHLQRSCVRFNSGGSGSFVSANGLVLTNHHVGADAIQKLSDEKNDLLKNGFYAKTLDQELKCVDDELDVLMEIIDVTQTVKDSIKPEMTAKEAFAARRAAIARIEEESEKKKDGLQGEVVTLYQGYQFHLYRYKRYTDVRLVFAPEQAIAFFGGDADNFAFPRYDLDCCLFRIYENGKPAQIEHYLKWSEAGVKENDLVFVSGHPGRTSRLNTVAELEYLRDTGFPFLLQRLNRMEVMLTVFSGQGQEFERRAKDDLFGVANSRKARMGVLEGLQDPDIMAKKKDREKKLQETVVSDVRLREVADAWDTIAKAQAVRGKHIKRHALLEQGAGFNSTLFGIARTLVRAAAEFPKANEKRLEGFRESDKKSLELRLFSKQPIYPDFETAKFIDSLGWCASILGVDDPLMQKILAGKSPRQRAEEIMAGTKLLDLEARKKLYDGGAKAIEASDDPLIQLASLVDPEARQVREIIETQVDEPKRQGYDKIAKARFAIEGTANYPDATFTLRFSFGTVRGYEEAGKKIPFQTVMGGAFEKAATNNNKPPFDLPPRWLERKAKINLQTPFNFVCATDSIGGNSGSPVVNRQGELVGLLFDGNIQSLVWDVGYTDVQARSVCVNSQAIPEALRTVYDAGDLAKEILNGKR